MVPSLFLLFTLFNAREVLGRCDEEKSILFSFVVGLFSMTLTEKKGRSIAIDVNKGRHPWWWWVSSRIK